MRTTPQGRSRRFGPALAIIAAFAAALLLAAPAMAGHGHHGGHQHDRYCDHDYRNDEYRYGNHRGRHERRPFYGSYGTYDERQWRSYGHRDRHSGHYYGSGYRHGHHRDHKHRHRPVEFIAPRFRHAWRYCEMHGGWFRIIDFLFVY